MSNCKFEQWAKTAIFGFASLIAAASEWPAVAADVAGISQLQSADRQAVLEDGARKEGGVTVYTIGTQIQPIVDGFQKRFPFIKLTVSRQSAADTTRKVMEEYQAGAYFVDVFEQPTAGMLVPRQLGFLQGYKTPEARAYNPEAIESSGLWISVREGYIGLGFNTDRIAPADAPRSYKDLLDPKWKGRMAIAGATSTVAGWIGGIVVSQGLEFVRALKPQNVRVYPISGRAVANLLISGEVAMSPTIYSSHVDASRRTGARLEWRAPGPVPVTDTSVALAAKAPHPHAAMLYIDYLLSKEAQLLLLDLGYLSARTDMPPSEFTKVEKLYLANRPGYIEEFESWSRLYEQVFLDGAPAPKVAE